MKRATLAALLLLAGAPRADRPNIILIFADDIGISGFGCTGGSFATPNIDAMAAAGTRFEFCFAAPLCGPSRAQVLTGRYGFRTGVTDNDLGAKAHPSREVSIAKVLHDAGYATAVAGKWQQLRHLSTPEEGRAWGFDEFMVWGSEGKGRGERYWDPAYNHNGKWRDDLKEKYGPDVLHGFVVDFIERRRDKPFFVYYPTPLVHAPILRTPHSSGSKSLADNISYLDKLVGRLLADLDRLGLRERTLVVFTGDNGTVGGGTVHGRRVDGGKGTMHEGGSRVPLIAHWKGTVPTGVVSKDLVDFSDFFPTFAELAGAKLPEGVTIDGRSFAPRLRGEKGAAREWVYVQLGDKRYVRDARWKLTAGGALYDMKDAPFAETPAEDAEARARLQQALDSLGR